MEVPRVYETHTRTRVGVKSNLGTAFTKKERQEMGLRGLLPASIQTLDSQLARVEHQVNTKGTDFDKHITLMNMRQRNERVFYAYVIKNMRKTLPLVYTPVVGEACQKFSKMFRRPEGMTLSWEDRGSVAECVENWPRPADAPRIAVITDGSRILGLGDLGWNGLGISIGKLSLYVACAGVHPQSTMPIVVDVGTDTDEVRNDPLYLGLRRKRPSTEELVEFVDEIMDALHAKYPNLIIQFEDWSGEHAFLFLDRYKDKYPMFNDDIQGTGSVILGGFINAARQSCNASGKDLNDQRILMVGSGSAAIGVAKQLMSFFEGNGMSKEEARKRIWTTDSKGLVTMNRGDDLAEHKKYFARRDNGDDQFKNLEDIVDYVKPTAIFGLSTVRGTFNESVLRKMAEYNKRPIVFPLSNPTTKSECTFEEALRYTDGRAIFAAGSPFDNVEFQGKTRFADQGNNNYIFPGLGLAGALSKANRISDDVVTEAAKALADTVNEEEAEEGRIYPKLERIREVSCNIATRCIQLINKQGHARDDGYTAKFSEKELHDWVQHQMWVPSYDTD
ncbi:malate dehydrogenase (oxaloacetate-decarboxylating) (NADP(+)) [Malassezia yamatoensis]|uniref:Malic enzyme n=1 Tax=Malassezia yamatoensis TaxID=253288 RepID=A0AAJ5YSY7_9BASI|nr:malate dehydrogenase (oxaloacetate-decarboxylating) (NADP(+)) [Malassezia yamatoensis]